MDIDDTFGCGILIAWAIGALISLAITVGIVIVAIHFINKFW